MKTWEIYKIALENPKAKFKRLAHDCICYMDEEKGQLQICDMPKSYPVARVDEDWELVREPVDFMTAVNSGEYIRPENVITNSFRPWDYWDLSLNRINGKWYIWTE